MTEKIKLIELAVDRKQAEAYLRTKDIKPIRGDVIRQRDATIIHATKLFRMGLFEKTTARLLRQRWPEADPNQILSRVHSVYEMQNPDKFGIESLLDKMERDDILAEEPSDFPASELEDRPDDEQGWLIDDMVPDDDAILNQGDGGAGKTTTMLQLAVAVATGRPWLGLSTGVIPKRVLFFSCEERSEKIRMRIKPLLYGPSAPYGTEVQWSDLDNLRIIGLADRDALIATKDAVGRIVATEMFRYFEKKIEEHKPALVIVDSLYDIYGGDENTRAQVRQFVGMLRRFTGKYTCALIVLGHPSLYGMSSGKGTSGSTGWRNAFRGMLYTTKSKKKDGTETHKIESMKGNYGAPGAVINLIWRDGIFVPLEADDQAAAKTADSAKAKFLELLTIYVNEERGVTESPNTRNYAPRVFADDSRGGEFTKADFKDAMDSLFSDGAIEIRGYKNKARQNAQRLEPTGTRSSPVAGDDDPEWLK
jgi:RecA-family ATPase